MHEMRVLKGERQREMCGGRVINHAKLINEITVAEEYEG